MRSETAILVFGNSSVQEARQKNFAPGLGQGASVRIAEYLIRHTLTTARATGLDVLPHFHTQQVGDTFGERLAHAFARAFGLGYRRVMVIGTDSPDLQVAHLLEAEEELRHGQLVFGPAMDGGVYLIGASQEHFRQEVFAGLPWKAEGVQADMQAYAVEVTAEQHWLGPLEDLDDAQDVRRFVAQGHSGLAQEIRRLLKSPVLSHKPVVFWLPQQHAAWAHGLRAPPMAA